ncbi:MAG: hypothetical protein WD342_07725 [Verrucomicrobiales bacterium]
MKATLGAILVAFTLPLLLFADTPALLAPEAVAIAQADLEARDLQDRIFIEQLALKKESVLNGAARWEVTWSGTFPAQTEGRKEFGLRIAMDGTRKRVVK